MRRTSIPARRTWPWTITWSISAIPYLFKTADFGQTWTRIDATLPKGHPLDYTLSIAENPHRRGMVFAGTGHAFFYSRDDGRTWTQFKDKLPAAPVNWIEVPKNAAEVAVATYGRGVWILRDVWQLERTPRPHRRRRRTFSCSSRCLASGGPRPARPTSCSIIAAAPTSPVTVEVLGADGAVLSTKQVQARAGLNRWSWNLLMAAPTQPVLRSIPPDNPYIWDAGRWQKRERPVTHWGLGAQRWQPRAAPGKYTVRMTYNGRQHTQPFEIWRDVTLPSTDVDLVAGTDLQRNLVTHGQ